MSKEKEALLSQYVSALMDYDSEDEQGDEKIKEGKKKKAENILKLFKKHKNVSLSDAKVTILPQSCQNNSKSKSTIQERISHDCPKCAKYFSSKKEKESHIKLSKSIWWICNKI